MDLNNNSIALSVCNIAFLLSMSLGPFCNACSRAWMHVSLAAVCTCKSASEARRRFTASDEATTEFQWRTS
jgi:hypothetical protein